MGFRVWDCRLAGPKRWWAWGRHAPRATRRFELGCRFRLAAKLRELRAQGLVRVLGFGEGGGGGGLGFRSRSLGLSRVLRLLRV